MLRVIIVSFVTALTAVFIRERDVINQASTVPRYFLPLLVVPITVLATIALYNAQKGIIKDDNKFNKYKLNSDNILIKLKLFEHNNDANWILIIPYLISICINFLVILLYIIYACGVFDLRILFESSWFGVPLCLIFPFLILYYAIIRQMILDDYKNEKLNFTINKKDKTNTEQQEIHLTHQSHIEGQEMENPIGTNIRGEGPGDQKKKTHI